MRVFFYIAASLSLVCCAPTHFKQLSSVLKKVDYLRVPSSSSSSFFVPRPPHRPRHDRKRKNKVIQSSPHQVPSSNTLLTYDEYDLINFDHEWSVFLAKEQSVGGVSHDDIVSILNHCLLAQSVLPMHLFVTRFIHVLKTMVVHNVTETVMIESGFSSDDLGASISGVANYLIIQKPFQANLLADLMNSWRVIFVDDSWDVIEHIFVSLHFLVHDGEYEGLAIFLRTLFLGLNPTRIPSYDQQRFGASVFQNFSSIVNKWSDDDFTALLTELRRHGMFIIQTYCKDGECGYDWIIQHEGQRFYGFPILSVPEEWHPKAKKFIADTTDAFQY